MSPTRPANRTTRRATSRPATFADLIRLLPQAAADWTARSPDRLCDSRTIYEYMDGAAEVYLVYAFSGLVVRTYHRADAPPIVVELFDMTTPADAFGVFTNGRDEDLPDAKVGQGAEQQGGLLTFWRDRYFAAIRVDADDPPRPALEAMLALGRAIAAAVGKDGARPPVLACLPGGGLITNSVRYCYRPNSLNYHYDFGNDNPLQLGPTAQAALASYRRGGARCYLLCILYPSVDVPEKARRRLATGLFRRIDPDGAAKLNDDRWGAIAVRGRLLAGTLDAPSRQTALDLARQAIQRYETVGETPAEKESHR